MSRELNLDAFARLVQIELEKFKEHWTERRKKSPTSYPKTLDEEDWWDQLAIFLDLDLE